MTAEPNSAEILADLRKLREQDAPTHGGRLLSYVYDSGMAELDELAGAAAEIARPLNGLDPTAFPSIAAMERDLIAFTRAALGGDARRIGQGGPVVGSVTSGGTESCLLAVKTARDLWRRQHGSTARPRLVTATTAHAAFQKAARLFDLDWDPVPVLSNGTLDPRAMTERLGPDVALVVVSAPAYPTGAIDPIAEVAAAAHREGISCHIDACFGGLVLPWWHDTPRWDFRVRGVTSISADLHKFGYAPKGVSVLLHRGRSRHRAQFFATTRWPGYPVVNPTLLGSRSASPLAAAWAITRRLGGSGFAALTASCQRSATSIAKAVSAIDGIELLGTPTGPSLALIEDRSVPAAHRVDPHHLADALLAEGYRIQHQPGLTQANGVRVPHSAHLTVTPATENALDGLESALRRAAAKVRGRPPANPWLEAGALRLLGYGTGARVPGPAMCWAILRVAGAGGSSLPGRLAPLMALTERLPPAVAEALLSELLARASEPARAR